MKATITSTATKVALKSSPPPSIEFEAGKHYVQLDGLRGMAILLVIGHHLAMGQIGNNAVLNTLQKAAVGGWCGVDLFFVLSGFLITGNLIDSKGHPHWYRNFVARRVLRIFPVYYGYLFFVALMAVFVNHDSPWAHGGWTPWIFGTNIAMSISQQWNVGNAPLGHFWSLAVEEHFYLLWPLLVLLLPNKKLAKFCLIAMVAVLLARTAFVLSTGNVTAAGILTPFKIDSLMAGASVALLMRSAKFRELATKYGPFVFGTVAVAAVAYMAFDGNRESLFTCTAGFSILATFFASLLVMAFRFESIKRLFSAPLLTMFGRYSYGLYVYHPIVYCWLHQRLVVHPIVQLTHQPQTALFLDMALIVVASTTVAALSFRFYEKPILGWKRFL